MATVGIKETKDALSFVGDIVQAISVAYEDGKIEFMDGLSVILATRGIGAALRDIEKVPQELLDLDREELQELVDLVVDKFNVPVERCEEVIKISLDLLVNILSLIKALEK